MLLTATGYVFLGLAVLPFIYYLLALYSSWRMFRKKATAQGSDFTPPVSILKPVRGADPEVYENFASFCRQDYPDYEILFCVGPDDEQAIGAIEQLKRDFPARRIGLLFGSRRRAVNDKVAKLGRLVTEAQHEYLAISDSDVRVAPDYLRRVMAPLADAHVGGLTCFYGSIRDETFADRLQTMGMFSDFYAGIIVARQLDGVKFALGQTIVARKSLITGFGGYQRLENRPGDDLLTGRLISEQGYEVKLLPYTVSTVSDYRSLRELLQKRLRWIVVMRHMRPWGHLGLLLTQGLPWSIVAIAIRPTMAVALSYLGAYCVLRLAMTWSIGVWGLRRPGLLKEAVLIPVWDAVACLLWVASFLRNSVRWRGGEYYIRDGELVPATSPSTGD
ncbi:MAG: glycosyltransferase [Acidobacteriaceae bacterium]|nr:glycosyltransferase [Acidobacteriaceae bacterium]